MSKVYDIITNRVLELLEKGVTPWRRPWNGEQSHPRNLVSGKPYRGVNVFLLHSVGYESPWWISYKQARDRGGYVKRGEKGYPAIFWKWLERKDSETGELKKVPCLRMYTVFNCEQCEGVEYPSNISSKREHQPISACERIVQDMPNPPKIQNGKIKASYTPFNDTVNMPNPERFNSDEDYYAVLFHEISHSTGHSSRLERKGITGEIVFGSQTYGKEELIAEMGATYLCGTAGIENKVLDQSASYIDGWLRAIKKDNRLVISAASQAQKAADYVLGK